MTQPNRENYEIALSLVEAGAWRVDHATGLVFGKRGNPFKRTNTDGYVQIKYRDPNNYRRERSVLAHRLVWESWHGPIGEGLEVNHIDGVKINNALSNLEAIAHLDNVRHAIETGLTRALRGADTGNALLTDAQVLEIYERAWRGEDQAAIAEDYPVGRNSVSNIKQGHAWTHVTGHKRPA